MDHQGDTEVTGGGYRRPWYLYAVVALVVVAVVAGAVSQWGRGDPGASPAPVDTPSASDRRPAPASPRTFLAGVELLPPAGPWTPARRRHPVAGQNAGASCGYDAPALRVRGVRPLNRASGTTCAAGDAARSIVLRSRHHGRFAWHSAVLTYPVAPPPGFTGPARTRHGVRGWWTGHSVAWRVGRQYAVVRGDLPGTTLARVVGAFHVGDFGSLEMGPVPGVRVSHQALYESPTHREAGYTAFTLGERASLGDTQVMTRVVAGAAIEDRLLAAGARPAGQVHGRPAVFAQEAGTALLAWELEPGVVAVVACLGATAGTDAEPGLRRVAARTVVVPPR